MNVLITGASSGIGLELTRIALEKGDHVFAHARNLAHAEDLILLQNHFQKLELIFQELTEEDAYLKISQAISGCDHLDILINNAGVYLDDKTLDDFKKSYQINTIFPLFLTRSLINKLKKSQNPKSIQITSQMGSISDNTSGGSYSYRSSKSALNMLFKSLSIDEPWLTSLLIHPGWVKTKMGGENAPLEPSVSAAGIWNVINSASLKQNGMFVNYLGKRIEW